MANIFDPMGRSSQLAGAMSPNTGYGPSQGGLESPGSDFPQAGGPMPQQQGQMNPGANQGQSGQEPPETPQEQMLKEVLGIMRKRRKIVGLSQGIGQAGIGNLGF